MSWWDGLPNLYSEPEKFGLTIVGTLDDGGAYEFDMFLVLRDEAGNYYTADDAGCSCPSPFEDFTSMDKLDGPYTRDQVLAAMEEWIGTGEDSRLHDERSWGSLSLDEVVDLKDKLWTES
jgi:hypothetical protein